MGELVQQYRSHANLVAYYKLDGNAVDYKGGSTLTTGGSISYTSGKFGSSLQTSTGGGNYLYTNSNHGTTYNQAKSISLWFNLNAQPSSGDWNTFASISYATGDVFYYMAYHNNSGTYRLIFTRDRWNTDSFSAGYNVTIANGGWHHIMMSWTGTQMVGFYDGAQLFSPVSTGTSTGSNGAPDRFTIGSIPALDARYAQAKIDDVGFFDTNLTSTDAAKIYAAGPRAGLMFF